MPYTSWGLMSRAEIAEVLADHDMSPDVTVWQDDEPPEWFEPPAKCPICQFEIDEHEAYRVSPVSGEITQCMADDVWHDRQETR